MLIVKIVTFGYRHGVPPKGFYVLDCRNLAIRIA